jgi:hypothetical protein
MEMTRLEIMVIFSALLMANQKNFRNPKKILPIALEIIFLLLPELARGHFSKNLLFLHIDFILHSIHPLAF